MDLETIEALAHLGERIDTLAMTLRTEIRDGLAENRRHTEQLFEQSNRRTDVLIGSVRDDIRLLAEGFASISEKVDTLLRRR